MIIQVPITTEVIEKNASLQPNGKVEDKRIIIEIDTRKRDYHKLFNLNRKVTIGWINETTFDVQELSGFHWPIVYRITTATHLLCRRCRPASLLHAGASRTLHEA